VVNYCPLIRTAWDYEGVVTSDVVVEDMVLDGNLDESTEAWRIGAPSLLHLEGAVDAILRNVTVQNANAGGILLIGGHDNLIENVTVEKVRGHGIFTFEEADTVISSATVRQAGYATSGVSGDGIFVVGSSDVIVENSLVEGCLRHGLHPGGDLNRGGVWINNVSRDNGSNGFHFCWDNFDIIVTNNVLENNGRYGVGGLGLGGEFGDYFNTVSDNLIRGNAREGIQVNGGSYNTITGNTIVDNSQVRLGSYSGILLANSTYVVVTDNTIGTATDEASQKYGIQEYGTANRNWIVGNDTSDNVEGGIYLTGSSTTVEDNLGSIHSDDS
jgi:parallel beta-helix repeat protein